MGRKKQDLNANITRPFLLPSDAVFDLIVHSAGKAHSVPKTKSQRQAFFDVNYQGTVNLCKAIDLLHEKPKAFVFISTVSVYGLDAGEMISEQHPLLGNSPYAKSKMQAEEYLTAWARNNNIALSILRLPLISGPNPPGNLGAMIRGIETGRYLSIGEADAKKSIVVAEDVAGIVPKLINKSGIYNLTDGYHPSFAEIERAIAQALGKRPPIKVPLILAQVLAKVGDLLGSKAPINTRKLKKITSTLTFDDSKARHELQWAPRAVLSTIAELTKPMG